MSEPARLFCYIVKVETGSQEQADEVMIERLNCDEDYGFDYQLHWDRSPGPLPDGELIPCYPANREEVPQSG